MLDVDWSQLNKVLEDKFNRVHGIFAINKKVGETSHDIVDDVRKILGTKKVGHAGALDPFATGLMIILVGRFTKKADYLILQDKTYTAKVILGISSDSHDIDGNLQRVDQDFKLDEEKLKSAIEKFNTNYKQQVPIFSSVKVSGMKLRELARGSESFELEEVDGKPVASFKLNPDTLGRFKKHAVDGVIEIEVPEKEVSVDIRLKSVNLINPSKLDITIFENIDKDFYSLEIEVDCSKGTYIRQLAYDLGEALGTVGILTELERTRIGEITLDQSIHIEELKP